MPLRNLTLSRWLLVPCLAAACCGPAVIPAAQAMEAAPAAKKSAEGKASDEKLESKETKSDREKQDSKDSKKPAEKKTVGIALITVKGSYTEGTQAAGLFGQLNESLRDGLARLEKAGKASNVDAVVLTIDEPSLGWGQIHEFRVAIKKLRDNGKKVYAWATMPDNKTYLLASACDKVYLPETGALGIFGMRAEVTFYKNLFDMLDVEADILRVGEFKSAAEPFTRTEMSDQFRQETTELLDDLYSNLVTGIAEGRGVDRKVVEAAIGSGGRCRPGPRKRPA